MKYSIYHNRAERGLLRKVTVWTVHVDLTISHAEEYTAKHNNMLEDVISKIIRYDADLEAYPEEEYYTTIDRLLSHKWGVVFDRHSRAQDYEADVVANLEKWKEEIIRCQQPLDRDKHFHG